MMRLLELVNDTLGDESKAARIRQALDAMPEERIIRELLFPLILRTNQRLEVIGDSGVWELCNAVSAQVRANAERQGGALIPQPARAETGAPPARVSP